MCVCVSQTGVAVPRKTHPTIHSIYWHAYYHGDAALHILLLNGICQICSVTRLSGQRPLFSSRLTDDSAKALGLRPTRARLRYVHLFIHRAPKYVF